MRYLTVTSLGQLGEADVRFGDMTVLVGPQATGKSIFLQLVKLVLDSNHIAQTLKKHGFDWQGVIADFLTLYFGEGMQSIWRPDTLVRVDGTDFALDEELSRKNGRGESLFLIPAQRVMTLKNGWPRAFTDYETGDPYVVKQFSERLRLMMERGLGAGKSPIFPQPDRMNVTLRHDIETSIFDGAEVILDRSGMRRRIVLQLPHHRQRLPFMTWSAGQREFVPLLLGLYWLMPAGGAKKRGVDWVVIEEPEMGLHPQAISSLLAVLLELIHKGYKLIISTHSPQVLEMLWAVRVLSRSQAAPEALTEIFGLERNRFTLSLSRDVLTRRVLKTYYFARQGDEVRVQDISSLDPAHVDEAVADWGGLTAFSTRVSEILSRAARG